MKILITGGLGFIGTHLATWLIDEGHEVTLLDILSAQIHGEIPAPAVPAGATVVRQDVRDITLRPEVVEGTDTIFHLAAETGTAQSMYRIQHYVSVNECGTAALLEAIAAAKKRPRRLVLASSRSVYGEGAYRDERNPNELLQPAPRSRAQLAAGRWEHAAEDGAPLRAIPTPETLRVAPASVYAATKAAQELIINSAAEALGLSSVVLRLQNVYGEGQSLRNPYTGIISIFYNRGRQGLDIPVYEDGMESRDFVHVDDVVRALSRAMEADVPSGTTINVGSGQPTSVLALSRTLLAAAGFDVPVRVTGQYRVGDVRHCFADIGRLRALLHLKPEVTLESGLGRFCTWAARQPVEVDQLEVATAELRRKGLSSP